MQSLRDATRTYALVTAETISHNKILMTSRYLSTELYVGKIHCITSSELLIMIHTGNSNGVWQTGSALPQKKRVVIITRGDKRAGGAVCMMMGLFGIMGGITGVPIEKHLGPSEVKGGFWLSRRVVSFFFLLFDPSFFSLHVYVLSYTTLARVCTLQLGASYKSS